MSAFWESLAAYNETLNGIVWGIPMLALIVGTGIYFTVRLGFFQFTHFCHTMKNTIGKITEKRRTGKGEITPFQALTTALAATVGTGNIAGVAGAITLGGPGAVFWMWISALFGMVTKYAEVTLALKYRERNEKGDWVGGPMYYIVNGLGKGWRWLAVTFALFGAIAAFGMGNMTQANTVASAVNDTLQSLGLVGPERAAAINLIVGIVIASIAALVLFGGLKRIGAVTETLVPFMSVVYIVGALIVICANIEKIGPVISQIFEGAFNPGAALGGIAGITISNAMRLGIGRGVFSNEAGLGSASIAHAASSETNPVKQGLYGIFEVFMDTIVICTLTALCILMSGVYVPYGESAGAPLSIASFQSVFGAELGSILVTSGVVLFATATILSWALYGTRCCEFLLGAKSIRPYQMLFILFIIAGTTMHLQLVWDIADTLNGLMAIPNLIGLLSLSGVAVRLTRDYKRRRHELKKWR